MDSLGRSHPRNLRGNDGRAGGALGAVGYDSKGVRDCRTLVAAPHDPSFPLRLMSRRPPVRTASPDPASDVPLSKTRRKAAMHALQSLGETLVAMEPRQFAALRADVELPEPLVDAIVEARGITAWGGRKRQLQYVGKLMREVDPAPIERWLEDAARGHAEGAARHHALERWRERLLAEPGALDELAAAHPALDRTRLRSLIAKAHEEATHGAPPHAYRELFRVLKTLP